MIYLSATPEETAALDAKFEKCRRDNWKLLGLKEPVQANTHSVLGLYNAYVDQMRYGIGFISGGKTISPLELFTSWPT